MSDPVIGGEAQVIELALECIYVCQSCDQLSNAFAILECLPQVQAAHTQSLTVPLHIFEFQNVTLCIRLCDVIVYHYSAVSV